MIDKKIFYCWFGKGEMSALDKKCIESWKKHCPDYELILINEENYDYESNPYAKMHYEDGNWSGVSNAARLEFLRKYNGFYLDTDVELFKSLDALRVYDGGFITEFESGQPDSGVLGRGSKFPEYYAEVYKNLVLGTVLHKQFIKSMHEHYDVHGESVRTYGDGFTILGEEYFPTVRSGLFTENTIGIHYFENTWVKVAKNPEIETQKITDGIYPFPRMNVYYGNKLAFQEEGATVNFKVKNLLKKWDDADMLGRTDYLFNPRVVKLFCKDFEAEKINYDRTATLCNTVTPGGLIVTWMK
jgi:hypothetical protein